MNRLVWKLLRQHISIGQLTGFFVANLLGMTIVLLGVQFYRDILSVFTQGDSFMKKEYLIVTKKVSALSNLTGRSNHFSKEEMAELEAQPFTQSVGMFTPSMFKVSAGLGMREAGIHLATEMFFEAVPDDYVDIRLEKWHFDENTRTIPIVIPRNYLNLYNFGFAQSRNLPKLSEGVMGLIQMDITVRGDGKSESYKGNIVGFSNRLNTILVPQAFMDRANRRFAPGQEARPSRLIVEVKNPTDTAITDYFHRHNYETEGNALDAGKTAYFLKLITGIVMGVGLLISLLSLYILMLSVFLLLQKNTVKLENLLLTGYSPAEVALPYCLLTAALNTSVLLPAVGIVVALRTCYMELAQTVFPQLESGSLLPCILTGCVLALAVSLLNILAIRRKVAGIG